MDVSLGQSLHLVCFMECRMYARLPLGLIRQVYTLANIMDPLYNATCIRLPTGEGRYYGKVGWFVR